MIWISLVALVLSLAAVAVAYSAFRVSKNQLLDQRQHNRLSVIPLLQFERAGIPLPGNEYVGLYLKNDGIGVARLLYCETPEMKISVPASAKEDIEKALQEQGLYGAWAAILRARVSDLPDIYFQHEIQQYWKPGDERCLIGILCSEFNPDWKAEIERFLWELSMTIHYESLYGEEFSLALVAPEPSPDSGSVIWVPQWRFDPWQIISSFRDAR